MHVEDHLSSHPTEVSSGVQQRVSLARALVRSPSVFLLDEPLSHLDAEMRSRMRGELKRLQKAKRSTMLYVTHDQLEAMTMADRIAIMNEGRLQQVGTPREIYDRPANRFVATFIGEPPMNMIDATTANADDAIVAAIRGWRTCRTAGRRASANDCCEPFPRTAAGLRSAFDPPTSMSSPRGTPGCRRECGCESSAVTTS